MFDDLIKFLGTLSLVVIAVTLLVRFLFDLWGHIGELERQLAKKEEREDHADYEEGQHKTNRRFRDEHEEDEDDEKESWRRN